MNEFSITEETPGSFLNTNEFYEATILPTVYILHISTPAIIADRIAVEWFTYQSGLCFNSLTDAESFGFNYGNPGDCFSVIEYAPIPF